MFLSQLGLLESARAAWSFVKGASPSILVREFRLRLNGSQDGLLLPPARMMYRVISTRWAATFLDSGETIVDAMADTLRSAGKSLDDFDSVLDFGCGCGRLLRHLPKFTKAKLFGCDYNPELVAWCAKNLPIAKLAVNSLEPPLPYSDGSFDFIYARSVFTHLPEKAQIEWMRELHRVLAPGGVLYFTMHGEQYFEQLTAHEAETVRNGGIVLHLSSEAGRNICTSFELPGYVETHILNGFHLLRFIPGTSEAHLRQDAYIAIKS
jgi:SAM-dependent methyltransferase